MFYNLYRVTKRHVVTCVLVYKAEIDTSALYYTLTKPGVICVRKIIKTICELYLLIVAADNCNVKMIFFVKCFVMCQGVRLLYNTYKWNIFF